MQLIQKIEISYLRSLYSATISNIGHLNVLFGKNDSGKSNVLRALNLFFNDESDPDRDPNFDIDFSDARRIQAQKGASKQFFSVRLHFRVPANYRKSLGETIWVKRQWNRYGEMNEVTPHSLTKGGRIQLTKFLSTIDFTYIPAIKDTESFRRLIQRMYEATAEGQGLQASTSQFIDSIRSETVDLSQALSTTLGSPTQLAAPAEMGDLFKSLDFSHGEDEHSLLLQKGDGIKARHIPELLRYINDKEKSVRFFIWGFEEPENSLDLRAATLEAQRFAAVARRQDTQVFITSHSPAFYLSGESSNRYPLRRYFVCKQEMADGGVEPKNAVRPIDNLDDAENVMEDASLYELPYIIRKLSELQARNTALIAQVGQFETELAALNRPTVFVEGESEVQVLASAIAGRMRRAVVRKLKGTPTTTSELLRRIFNDGGTLTYAPTLFLFDNDVAGRQAYQNLGGVESAEAPTSLTETMFAWCLPKTTEFNEFLTEFGIPEEKCFFPLEFIFAGEAAAKKLLAIMSPSQITDSRIRIRQEYHECLRQEQSFELRNCEPGTKEWLWSRGVPNGLKADYLQACKNDEIPSTLDALLDVITRSLRTH